VASRRALRELAVQAGEPMQTILDRAIETYRRQRFLEEVNAAYAVLRQEAGAWEAWKKEGMEWEVSLQDGLDANETWTEGGETVPGRRKGKSRG
jgi:hypothetical protein